LCLVRFWWSCVWPFVPLYFGPFWTVSSLNLMMRSSPARSEKKTSTRHQSNDNTWTTSLFIFRSTAITEGHALLKTRCNIQAHNRLKRAPIDLLRWCFWRKSRPWSQSLSNLDVQNEGWSNVLKLAEQI
jgi:hypothetical protein